MNKLNEAQGICVNMPEKVFFSNTAGYIVKNDFYFSIYKEKPVEGQKQSQATVSEKLESGQISISKKLESGETYPTIYIKGLEQFFADNGMRDACMDAFAKMFHAGGNKDWEVSFGRLRDTEEKCIVITAAADSLKSDFNVYLQLSAKCEFTNIPDIPDAVTLQVFIDDFDYFFTDLPSRISYQASIQRGFAVYVENFGAYLSTDARQQVTSVHKGDTCYLSWQIAQKERASAFLYNEAGSIVANLPPYAVKVDKDQKFTLTAYNDFCSVSLSTIVYRTLWEKTRKADSTFPSLGQQGRFKFYRHWDGFYYFYASPKLYRSKDLVSWEEYVENKTLPATYTFYSSALLEGKFCVCYLDSAQITYCEIDLSDSEKKWTQYSVSSDLICGSTLGVYARNSDHGDAGLVVADKNQVILYDLVQGRLMNPAFLELPDDIQIKAIDIYSDDEKDALAILTEDRRIYYYDLKDDYRNNIFECTSSKSQTDDNISLIKTNAVYIVANQAVLETNDREKFTDTHFFPDFKEGTRPVLGAADCDTMIGFYQSKDGIEVWSYKF